MLDVNGDGTPDAFFSKPNLSNVPEEAQDYVVSLNANVEMIEVKGGFVLHYNLGGRVWNERMYLDPICTDDIIMNPNLTQNPGY